MSKVKHCTLCSKTALHWDGCSHLDCPNRRQVTAQAAYNGLGRRIIPVDDSNSYLSPEYKESLLGMPLAERRKLFEGEFAPEQPLDFKDERG